MRIFVTGAGGFIGSAISGYLSGIGHDVTGHSHSESGDITEDSLPDDVQVIVNAAGRLGGQGRDFSELTASNALLPDLLGRICFEREVHLVHISTPGVTGLLAGSDESLPYDPWGDYEVSKVRGEQALLDRPGLSGGRLTILRPDFVYGPGDLHKLAFFRQVSRGWMPLIGRNGARIRPTYCMDLCTATAAALPGGALNGDVYNIGGPEIVTVRELAREAAGCMERGLRLLPLPAFLFRMVLLLGPLCPSSLSESRLKLMGKDHFVSTDKAERAGFTPAWGIGKGVSETVSWYMREGLLS